MPRLFMFGDVVLSSADLNRIRRFSGRAGQASCRRKASLWAAVRQAMSRFRQGLERFMAPHALTRGIVSAAEELESRQFLSATLYVSASSGSDTNSGTAASPFRTIQHAATISAPGDTVDIFGGTYHETVTPARSGTAGAPITFQAVPGQKVIVDGANTVSGWTKYSGSIYVANDPYNLGFGNNQVFNNGQAMIFAQWPNTSLDLSHPTVAYAQGGGGGSLTDNALASSGVNWTGGTIHIISGEGWVAQTATVTSDSGNKLTFNLGEHRRSQRRCPCRATPSTSPASFRR